jgi:hypothetical protein
MVDADDSRSNILGLFAASCAGELWAPEHPPFAIFCSGVLASPHVPRHLSRDARLAREFPPHPLDGLDDELGWQSPATRTEFANMRAMIAAADV